MELLTNIRKSRKVMLAIATAWLASCVSESQADANGGKGYDYVVLTIADLTGGGIKGSASCKDASGRYSMALPCLPGGENLMSAVQSCGPEMVTLDTSQLHYVSVPFPAASRDGPRDFDVVRCVQSKVGYRFSAFNANQPGTEAGLGGDQKAFASLYSEPEANR